MKIVPFMELEGLLPVFCASCFISDSVMCVQNQCCFSLLIICYNLNGKQFFKGGQAPSMISKENVVENSN